MTFIPWSEKYTLQVEVLDTDHRTVIEMINHLRDSYQEKSAPTELADAFARLGQTVQEHFEREEQLMKRSRYPYRAAHREQHRQFKRDIYAVGKLFTADPACIDFRRLLAYLKAWWDNHIRRSDAIFVAYLNGVRTEAPEEVQQAAPSPSIECLDDNADDGLQTVTVKVPTDKVDALHTCARLFRRGGSEAETIVEIAHPFTTMTLDEAAIVAKGLMR